MGRRNNKGFTLVELLAVITIIGILSVISIVAVTRLINKSKNERDNSQEKTVAMAAESYMQANRGLLPKSIGETTTIFISNLRTNNYLKEDVLNSSGESCMTKSYVVVYKKSATKYEYKTHLLCGNAEDPNKDRLPEPTIDIKFYALDENGNEMDAASTTDFLSKVANPKYRITITGGSISGKDYEIEGYNYSISVTLKDTNNPNSTSSREVYSSGSLNANNSKKIVIPGDITAGSVSGDLKDYIDITQATDVAIHVIARNTEGVAYEKTTTLSGKKESSGSTTYNDTEKPICTSIKGQAKNENDWINKANYSSNPRKITVNCSDKGGSGCVRNKYTKTWPNTKEPSAEFSYIEVADNAGNKSGKVNSCKVRVNVDISPPVVSVDAYARGDSNNVTGDSVLNGAPIKSDGASDDKVTIADNSYKNLNGGWMNKSKYPNGVIYKVTITDNLYLKSYTWKVNEPNISSTTNANYSKYSTNSANDGIDTVNITASSGTCNTKSCTFYISFTKEGRRKGVLTVLDKAGNKVEYTIAANLDRTAPGKPSVSFKKKVDKKAYTPDTWTNSDVISHVKGSASDSLAGWSRYEYVYVKSETTNEVKGQVTADDTDGYVVKDNGTNRIKYRSCDKANNCSAYSDNYKVKVDKEAPTKPTVVGYNKGNNTSNLTSTSGLSSNGVSSGQWVGGYLLLEAKGSKDTQTSKDRSGFKGYVSTATGSVSDKKTINGNLRNVNENQGTSTISFVACDNAGNCSAATNFVTKIDLTPPSAPTLTGYGYNGASWGGQRVISSGRWHNGYAKVNAGSSIDTLSGGVYYVSEVNNSNVTKNSTKGSSRNVTNEGANIVVYYKACDKVHNCSGTKSFTLKLDWTAPSVPSISNPYNNTWVNFQYDVTGSTSDNISGISSWQYKYPSTGYTGFAASEYTNTAKTAIKTTFVAQRNDVVNIRACDNAGNCSNPASTIVKIDRTPPTCTPIARYDNWNGSGYSGGLTCSNIYTAASCSDPYGDCAATRWITTRGATQNVTNSTSYSSWTVEASGVSYLTWYVEDQAHNWSTCSTITVNKGTYSAHSSCGCASYQYSCQVPYTYYTYAASTARKCQPRWRQSEVWHCGAGVLNTDTNLCCATAHTGYTWSTCTSSVCQSYNTCCH